LPSFQDAGEGVLTALMKATKVNPPAHALSSKEDAGMWLKCGIHGT
jgi:hypothetical protein